MPNHVHLLVDTTYYDFSDCLKHNGCTRKYPLTDTMRLLKGSTARCCNQKINSSGAFWHHESYDHYVRNQKELLRILNYMYLNPVKARLVEDPDDWGFFYLSPELSYY
jgi:REP element-mobilizing transposase RayT